MFEQAGGDEEDAHQEVAANARLASQTLQVLRSVQTVQEAVLSGSLPLRTSPVEHGKRVFVGSLETRAW